MKSLVVTIYRAIIGGAARRAIITYLFGPLFYVLPTAFFAIDTYKGSTPLPAPLPAIKQYIDSKPWAIVICILWVVILIPFRAVVTWLNKETEKLEKPSAETVMAIANATEEVLGKDLMSLIPLADQLAADKLKGQPVTKAADAYFRVITPTSRIQELTEKIFVVFKSTFPGQLDDLRVVVAQIDNNLPQEYLAFAPSNHPPGDIFALKNPPAGSKSSFSAAATGRDLIIIEDIKREIGRKTGSRFVPILPGDPDDNKGSLIAYPVLYGPTRRVQFVISVKVARAAFFTAGAKDRYKRIIKPFADRISLEYALSVLKSL